MGGWWWKGVQVQRKGKAGNCKQQGASKQVAGKGRERKRWSTARTSEQKC